MFPLKSLLSHQEVLSLLTLEEYVLCGVGGFVYVYYKNKCIDHAQILPDHKIHFLKKGRNGKIFAGGGKYLCLCKFRDGSVEKIDYQTVSDWILNVEQIGSNELVIVTAHNQAQLWIITPLQAKACTIAPIGPCILYSAAILEESSSIYIFSGTVFNEVIIWKANFAEPGASKYTGCLTGHKGVIFSIDVKKSDDKHLTVCTTSDDRTARLAVITGPLCYGMEVQESRAIYGHTARVWKSLLNDKLFFTIGEDSVVCCCAYNGVILRKYSVHCGGGIRAITQGNKVAGQIATGGADGGVMMINTSLREEMTEVSYDGQAKDVPRKVAMFHAGIVFLTDTSLSWKSSDRILKTNHELFKNSTDLKASFKGIFAITTVCGRLILIDSKAFSAPEVFEIGENDRCESALWRDDYLLVSLSSGFIKVFHVFAASVIDLLYVLKISSSKQKAVTCFLPFKEIDRILIGDRRGELYLFKRDEISPMDILHGAHPCNMGVRDLMIRPNSGTVLTAGSGGRLNEIRVTESALFPLRSFAIPMESAVKLMTFGNDIVVAGFCSSLMKVWNLEKKMIVASHLCGGGHRSYDFFLADNIHFAYIKDKKIFLAKFSLNLCMIIRNGFHSRVINALQATDTGLIVSGGDDNTIRVSRILEKDIDVLHTMDHHVSAVRAIKLLHEPDGSVLIVAAGGREQMSVCRLTADLSSCHEVASFMPHTSDEKPDSRYMCLDTKQVNNSVFIFAGCSDCTLKVFSYDLCTKKLEYCNLCVYDHCILQLIVEGSLIMTFATDGYIVFWDLVGTIQETGAEPSAKIHLHQSGINCAVVWQRNLREILIATGGDDNRLCITGIDTTTLSVTSRWFSDTVHAAQITGLVLKEDYLLSTSVDQRVVLYHLQAWDNIQVREKNFVVTVPDVHGLTLLQNQQDSTLCVFGKGIEIIKIQT